MSTLKINKKIFYSFALQFLILALVLFYFTDGVFKTLNRTGISSMRFGPIIKGFFLGGVFVYSFFTLKKSKFFIFLSLLILFSFFLIGQLFLSFRLENINFLENFNTLIKYLSPIIYFLLVIDILKVKDYHKKLLKYYKVIITINSVLILIGLIGVPIFQTYDLTYRFGYDGLIYAQNEASYIFIFAIATVYYRKFYLGIKESFFWIVIIPSMIVGTKAVYLFLILLFCFHIIKRVPIKKILVFAFFVITFGYIIFNSFFNRIFMNSWNGFMYAYEKEGLLHALLSGRNTFIEKKLAPLVFDRWTFPNFLFGGQDVVQYSMEMGFIDLFLFFGLFGTLFYTYIFYKFIKMVSFKKEFKLFFVLTLGTIIFTSGHFFVSGIAGLHFILLLLINKKIE